MREQTPRARPLRTLFVSLIALIVVAPLGVSAAGTYHGARVISASLPASGGIGLADALNILEPYDLKKMDPVQRTHLVVEAMRRMHRDRALYLGDSDFVKVPVEMLTDKHYAQGQRNSLRLDRATPSEMLPSEAIDATQGRHTTHFSVIDKDGNRVGMTITLNLLLGSGLMPTGTGVLLARMARSTFPTVAFITVSD